MPHVTIRAVGTLAACLVLLAARADAQIYESVGIRAQGMAGAFVAVADDATATWWNPAGLAGGDFFGTTLEVGRAQEPATEPAGGPASRARVEAFSLAYPALGLSYYRLHVSEVRPATGSVAPDREDRGPTGVGLRSISLQQFGVTVGQSLGDHLVVATTLKLWRGSVGGASSSSPSLDRAGDLSGPGASRGDLDIGVMASMGAVKLGLAVRNLRRPTFGEGSDQVAVPRQVRAGTSFRTGALTVAFDADLTTTDTAVGKVRHVAAGTEMWLASRRIGLRGGLSANTVETARPALSAGASLLLRTHLYLETTVTAGLEASRTEWGVGSRLTF